MRRLLSMFSDRDLHLGAHVAELDPLGDGGCDGGCEEPPAAKADDDALGLYLVLRADQVQLFSLGNFFHDLD